MEFGLGLFSIIMFLVAVGLILIGHSMQMLSYNTSKNSCLIAFFFLLFYYFMKFITYLKDEENDDAGKVPKLLFDDKLAYRSGYNRPQVYNNDSKPSTDNEAQTPKPPGWKRYDVKTHSVVCD